MTRDNSAEPSSHTAPDSAPRRVPVKLGFKTSIISLFMALVLLIGLTLVTLSFSRIGAITDKAASSFIDKVAELSAARVTTQLQLVADNLRIMKALPTVQAAQLDDNPRLYALLAAMLQSNDQLFALYAGYDDGSFLEIDVIGRAGPGAHARVGAPAEAVYRLMLIVRSPSAPPRSKTLFLDGKLDTIGELPGPLDYDPRTRDWYTNAVRGGSSSLTGPYEFFATGQHGYTLQLALGDGQPGVVAGDVLLDVAEKLLGRQGLTPSGVAFLFDSAGRILAHPHMSQLLKRAEAAGEAIPMLRETDMHGVLAAIRGWRAGGDPEKFLSDPSGRLYAAAFRAIPSAGAAGLSLAVVAPVDEFFGSILSERVRLFAVTLGFVLLMLPIVYVIGSLMSRSLRKLADETDRIQRFQPAVAPPVRSMIREIDDLGRSVATMRQVTQTFSRFVPRRLVEKLVESGTPLQLGGTRREVTLLFSDIEGFTAITEGADPTLVMQQTSRYFAEMSQAIMRHSGSVDKFIGDAIMAIWNAPADDPDHAANACAGALAFQRANERVNADFARDGWPAYRTRIGLHSGEAVVGNIGSEDRMNYTALGAAVNLAARLEGLNRNYQTSILVSAALRHKVAGRFLFRTVDRISPKGFAEVFEIFELRGEIADSAPDEIAFCRDWDEVHAALAGDREAAASLLAAFLRRHPDDGVARFHQVRLAIGAM